MSDKLTSHDIASLYKRGATEQPSSQLDEQILKHAADEVADNKVTPIHKPKRFYQTWYGQLSTAASLVLVAVLYVQNSEQYQQSSQLNELQILADEQTALAPAASPEMMQSATQEQAQEQAQMMQLKQTQQRQQSEKMAGRQFAAPSMTAKSVLLLELEIITAEVANKFRRIDTFIADGNITAAKAQLTELLAAHPELKVHLNAQYKQLLQ
ncbi:hypothetical protein NDQ71_07895 [Pseudoalteromonas sp. KG3]|uniref:Anti-sigma factor n=1 Tax=Pseudoalteromonas prydzensis TaxID=182141 RepID=A0ABR9FN88_9GAMM|nr:MULTISPECIES: hypothetical protein [Pseudoalteromonas]MBE0458281.1 hypothetical protein [Pseudoalteromonas prydzensis]WKD24972.1 hypothetical protein NDQ71_07895 [Pseudoalteromonas sp. KG3]